MEKIIVDNGHRRHKCSFCGKVRFYSKMMKATGYKNREIKTRFGNICWVCVDNPDCQQFSRTY